MTACAENLLKYHVPGSQDAYYLPDFVTEDEETYLIRKISESPRQKWKILANRRLQIWGGDLTRKNVLLPQTLPDYITEFPDIMDRIRSTGAFDKSLHGRPNHVILNEYLPGQGIMPHEDGPSYHPAVATLTLGSHAVFHYYRYKADSDPSDQAPEDVGKGRPISTPPVMTVLLEPRSLIITTSELYTNHLHGIDGVEEDVFPSSRYQVDNAPLLGDEAAKGAVQNGGTLKREVRYSLTCRDVERVASARIAMGRR